MKAKFIYILTIVLSVSGVCAQGQSIASFRDKLSERDAMHSAAVNVTEHGRAGEIIRSYDATAKPRTVSGYRVRIYFGNGQNARDEALGVQARFRAQFPGVPTYMAYEIPSWVVTVGNCITTEEALMLWNRVRRNFSTAFLRQDEIPLSEILKQEAVTLPPVEEITEEASTREMESIPF